MIRRKGRLLKVVPEAPLKSKLSRLTPHDCIVGDPEALVHADWSREWGEGKGLL
jgi:hypothetical protein